MKKNLLKQAFSFFIVSGIGWIIDFSVYTFLTMSFGLNVLFANMISSIPAITYVFIMSNKSIFSKSTTNLKIQYKYIMYFVYQLILVTVVSSLGNIIYNFIINNDLITYQLIIKYLKLLIKIFITPITMTLNFIIMKFLVEKL